MKNFTKTAALTAAGAFAVGAAAMGTTTAHAAVMAPATQTVSYQAQFDFWNLTNSSDVAAAAKTNVHGLYTYRADVNWNTKTGKVVSAPLWDKTSHIESDVINMKVTVPANATSAQILAAEKAQVAQAIGLKPGATGAVKVNTVYVAGYVIQPGAWNNKTAWKDASKVKPQILAASKTLPKGTPVSMS